MARRERLIFVSRRRRRIRFAILGATALGILALVFGKMFWSM
jgi:hypothetical protein